MILVFLDRGASGIGGRASAPFPDVGFGENICRCLDERQSLVLSRRSPRPNPQDATKAIDATCEIKVGIPRHFPQDGPSYRDVFRVIRGRDVGEHHIEVKASASGAASYLDIREGRCSSPHSGKVIVRDAGSMAGDRIEVKTNPPASTRSESGRADLLCANS
jgi:hypothetical protein